jgi:hypothetical protein
MIPDPLKPDYEALFRFRKQCRQSGIRPSQKALRATVERIDLPEVRYFLETFVPSFRLTIDELN